MVTDPIEARIVELCERARNLSREIEECPDDRDRRLLVIALAFTVVTEAIDRMLPGGFAEKERPQTWKVTSEFYGMSARFARQTTDTLFRVWNRPPSGCMDVVSRYSFQEQLVALALLSNENSTTPVERWLPRRVGGGLW
jgi:hypothetical protein